MKSNTISLAGLKLLLIILSSILLSSCFGMETRIILNEDGTGTVSLVYRVSQMLAGFGTVSETSADLPLPVEREDFERVMTQLDGITLQRYSQEDTEDDRIITAEVEFSSLEALSLLLGIEEKSDIEVEMNGENGRFRYTIFRVIEETEDGETEEEETEKERPVDPESLALIQSLFADYRLSYTLEVPGQIDSSLPGSVEENGNSAAFDIAISEALATENDLVWEVVW
jgi:hypothetical protein